MKRQRQAKAPLPQIAEYIGPQPMFALCHRCHMLTLKGQDGAALTPALGLAHVCKKEGT